MTKKTALITGGSKGIGLAIAELLLEKGIEVFLIARDAAGLEQAKEVLTQKGHPAEAIQTIVMDVANPGQIAQLAGHLSQLPEGLFGLVNNAAREIIKPVCEFSIEEMESIWQVNMRAPVLLIQACYPFLKQAGGSVVNIGSIADERYFARYSIYGGSKAFLAAFTKHACKELGFDGIRINTVSPGGVDTPLMREVEKQFDPADIEAVKKSIPIGQRWGRSNEVAETVLFALSGPDYLHGADLRVHGGIY